MKLHKLLIFVKNTEEGKVKTRLAQSMGNKNALKIYKQLLSITDNIAKKLNVEKWVYYNNWIAKDDMFDNFLYKKALQAEGDLGRKMEIAFKDAFSNGANKVVIIGSDCPEITSEIIKHAYEALQNHDFVIGPALDGGYYLLGMSNFHPFVFKNKVWSTSSVLTDTIKEIEKEQLTFSLLPKLRDIDTQEDYEIFKDRL